MERVWMLWRDCASKLEDYLEFHELNLEDSVNGDEEVVMMDEINSFGETAKRVGNKYIQELSRLNDDRDATTGRSSYIDFGLEMIGLSRLFDTVLKSHVLSRMRPDEHVCLLFSRGARHQDKSTCEDCF